MIIFKTNINNVRTSSFFFSRLRDFETPPRRLPSREPLGAEVPCSPAELGHPLFAGRRARPGAALLADVRLQSGSVSIQQHSGVMQTSLGVGLHRVHW